MSLCRPGNSSTVQHHSRTAASVAAMVAAGITLSFGNNKSSLTTCCSLLCHARTHYAGTGGYTEDSAAAEVFPAMHAMLLVALCWWALPCLLPDTWYTGSLSTHMEQLHDQGSKAHISGDRNYPCPGKPSLPRVLTPRLGVPCDSPLLGIPRSVLLTFADSRQILAAGAVHVTLPVREHFHGTASLSTQSPGQQLWSPPTETASPISPTWRSLF